MLASKAPEEMVKLGECPLDPGMALRLIIKAGILS